MRGTLKLNVDAGCFSDGRTGWGFIVRNSAGLVTFAATKIDGITISPLMAECLGLRWCLEWAVENHVSNLSIESDAECVVKCLHGAPMIAEIDLVIVDCLDYLSRLSNVSVSSVRRSSTLVTLMSP